MINAPRKCARFAGLLLIPLLLLPVSASRAADPAPDNWRFFLTSDGLAEAWSSYISIGPASGRVYISHGVGLSVLHGSPTPSGDYVSILERAGDDLEVRESESGQLWSVYQEGIKLYRDSAWVDFRLDDISLSYKPDNIVRELIPFLPADTNLVYYLLPERLMCFDTGQILRTVLLESSSAAIGNFIDMYQSRREGVWITGSRGVLKVHIDRSRQFNAHDRYASPSPVLSDFREPYEDADGRLYCMATDSRDAANRLLRLENGEWRVLGGFEGNPLKGWPGEGDGYWVLNDAGEIVNVLDGGTFVYHKTGILESDIREVATTGDGSFLVSTSHGVARYTPPLWRTPAEVKDFSTRIHSINEDPRGRIWFAARDRIICLDGDEWKTYTLPDSLTSQPYFTRSIAPVSDDRIAIGTLPYQSYVLLFDPGSERFEKVYHPSVMRDDSAGIKHIGLVSPFGEGLAVVQTFPDPLPSLGEPADFSLELFDGKNFSLLMDRGHDWGLEVLRYILRTSRGEVWLGGQMDTGGLIDEEGSYRKVELDPEVGQNGFFVVHENPDGTIWIGGRNDILGCSDGSWKPLLSGLSGVRSIATGPDSSIWVASGTGVHRFYRGSWITHTEEEGLPNNAAFSVFADSRGRVWAGTISGISLYHPDADRDPPLTILQEAQNPHEFSPQGEVRMIFSGLDTWKHTRADRILYSYRIDDGEWSPYRNSRVAIFSNLEYGSHHFEVRSMDVNLNVDPEPATYDIVVIRPWYREPAFQVIMFTGTGLIILLISLAIHRHIMLEKLVRERTRDLKDANVKLKQEHENLESMLREKAFLVDVANQLNTPSLTSQEMRRVLELISSQTHIDVIFIADQSSGENDLYRPVMLVSRGGFFTYPGDSGSGFRVSGQIRKELMEAGKSVIPDTSKKMPLENSFPLDREIRSACIFPSFIRGKVVGIIGFCAHEEHEWDPGKCKLLRAASDMIVNAWGKYREFHARLEAEKSKTDAIQMADRASRMASIGVIAAGITHEINQPLNDIKVTADSVLMWDRANRNILPEHFSNWLKSISGSVDRIAGIIKQMRSYWSSPEQGMSTPVLINRAVHSAVSLLNRQLDSHGITLEIEERDFDLNVLGNRVNLEQIVINLVVNAMHALDGVRDRNKKISAVVYREDNRAILKVNDNGPGLPEGEEEKLFDPFFTTKNSVDGMGLGLAIVKRFAESCGGRVEARNNENSGATFIVSLPLYLES